MNADRFRLPRCIKHVSNHLEQRSHCYKSLHTGHQGEVYVQEDILQEDGIPKSTHGMWINETSVGARMFRVCLFTLTIMPILLPSLLQYHAIAKVRCHTLL